MIPGCIAAMAIKQILRLLFFLFAIQVGSFLLFCFSETACQDPQRLMFLPELEGMVADWNNNNDNVKMESSKLKVPILNNRTAVVVTMSYVDQCEAVRLRHLIDTSGLHVWLLHGHDILRKKKPGAIALSENITTRIPGLHLWPQLKEPIENFDSRVSGATKSSFLKFLIEHAQYDYAWHVESDVFFTGAWRSALVSKDRESDFLCTKSFNQTGERWWTKIGNGTCTIDGKNCSQILPKQSYWMATRVSRRLAVSLIESLASNQITGHHEALIAAFCKERGFKLQTLKAYLIGKTFYAGSTVPYKERAREKRSSTLARDGKVFKSKLYHPVKCVAYSSPQVMQAEIDQWLS